MRVFMSINESAFITAGDDGANYFGQWVFWLG